MKELLSQVIEGCTLCGACQRQCGFLQKNGLPGEIAKSLSGNGSDSAQNAQLAFECSLCGLCTALCPENLRLDTMFLAMRRHATAAGALNMKKYATILGYERRGNSKLFSWYGLPEGCDTVFFPGCALSGTRSDTTFKMYAYLAKAIPSLGVVLDCCNKPSHDLGRQGYFESMFGEMRDWLAGRGVKKVLTACPNCYRVFKEYGGPLQASTVWEHMAGNGLSASRKREGTVAVHDPCPLRHEPEIHAAARTIIQSYGLEIQEMRHKKKRTYCCGEGGAVHFVAPSLARNWTERRAKEAGAGRMVTYCAGCAEFLGRKAKVAHLADLAFSPDQAMNGKCKVARAPFTYLHRLRLKRRLQKAVSVKESRERGPRAKA
jgi:Fe-S oxidoreductase